MALQSFSAEDPFIEAFLSACRNAGHAVMEDVTGPVEEGAGPGDQNVKDGRRFSVADPKSGPEHLHLVRGSA